MGKFWQTQPQRYPLYQHNIVTLPYILPLILNETNNWLHYTIAKKQSNNSGDFYSAIHPKIVTFYYELSKFIPQKDKLTHIMVPDEFFSAKS